MKLKTLITGMLIAAAGTLAAVDWAQVERDWQADADQARREVRNQPYKIATENPRADLTAIPELGIGVHFFDDQVRDDLYQAGVGRTRHTIYWYMIENTPEPGVYDAQAVADLDRLVEAYRASGIEPSFVVHGNAPGTSFANKEEAYRRFADFMAWLVARYPDITYWELWNEMDVAFTDLFGAMNDVPMTERGKLYAEMLKVVTPAIRKANPNAVVVLGGIAHFNDFARGVYEGGGKDYFDVMNIHTYGIPLKYQFLQSGLGLRELMNEFGDGDKPIWNTEFGAGAEGLTMAWGVPEEDTANRYDQLQLEQLKECIELNLAARVYQKMFIYQHRAGLEADDAMRARLHEKLGEDYNLDNLGYTLTRTDGSWRPAFQYIVEAQPNTEYYNQFRNR